jgi:hypothetical protein
MRGLSDTEVLSGNHPLLLRPEMRQSVDLRWHGRSLAVVIRGIVRSLAPWPFFVVAVLILLHGPALMRSL